MSVFEITREEQAAIIRIAQEGGKQESFVFLVVSDSHKDGQNAAFDFLIACEEYFKMKIDQRRVQIVIIAQDDLSYSEVAPRANFLLMVNESSDPNGHQELPEYHPELATTLPVEK